MSVILAILLSALAMTLIVGVRYLIVSGAFAAATRLKHPGLYRGLDPQMRSEIVWSLASAAIYGFAMAAEMRRDERGVAASAAAALGVLGALLFAAMIAAGVVVMLSG